MSKSESTRFPVTVSRLPVTRCDVCGRTLAYRPGQASAVLTQHYNRMHPEALTGTRDTSRSGSRRPAQPGYPRAKQVIASGSLESWQTS